MNYRTRRLIGIVMGILGAALFYMSFNTVEPVEGIYKRLNEFIEMQWILGIATISYGLYFFFSAKPVNDKSKS